MAWRRTGDRPLSEAMMALFTDACMCHTASMNQRKLPCVCQLWIWVYGLFSQFAFLESVDTLSPRWNGHNFANDIFKVSRFPFIKWLDKNMGCSHYRNRPVWQCFEYDGTSFFILLILHSFAYSNLNWLKSVRIWIAIEKYLMKQLLGPDSVTTVTRVTTGRGGNLFSPFPLLDSVNTLEAQTKLPPFSRRHFQNNFFIWKLMYLIKIWCRVLVIFALIWACLCRIATSCCTYVFF